MDNEDEIYEAFEHANKLDLQWDRVKGSKSYVIEKSADPTGPSI